ncbi:MAG: 1,4-alpha-glucan branching enzyme [Alphaproteobacteria bacterium RIFOXYD12_FULL_60_8]|nr:MAG: 1,4-alpha-glucan branching enzyme [Alphaproteobacteria bacterium RIFOXYD12_FULL_60_8]
MDKSAFKKAAEAIAKAQHGDPFSFLGPHLAGQGRSVVRAFLPYASQAEVISRSGSVMAVMDKVHPDGLFQAEVAGEAPQYRLRVQPFEGQVHEIDDPYRFPPLIGELDLHLLAEGNHLQSFERLGAHPRVQDGVAGTYFSVWAPNARRVSVIGDFNFWDGRRNPMRNHPGSGIWDIFLPGVGEGALYKYEILGPDGNLLPEKTDPYAFQCEVPPRTACVVHDGRSFPWSDKEWMERRSDLNRHDAPMSIYEVHLGSWRRIVEEDNRPLSYRELAEQLVPYVKDMGFTHLELLPVSEFPFDGSWGYQPIGLFAPTSRFGSPEDFSYFIDCCHREGLGVIVDWVPGHFPEDAHGLGWFDGSHLYEHADPRQGRHMDWGTLIYNYGRSEVANYLLTNALFWLDRYHIDGLRVDAVASMLYLDYSRKSGEWIPNRFGGKENLEAIAFLKRLNEVVYAHNHGVFTCAEESTAWPMVSRPVHLGGLGFGFKWNMGWMHDTLRYMSEDPIHRKYHHDKLTFGLLYAFQENFILPISHDEVVHGKGSLLGRMPGDRWQKFANLRLYYTFMFTHPGKKLLFMGCEIAQPGEWKHDQSLDWHLLGDIYHEGVRRSVRDLNHLYRNTPALHLLDGEGQGFSWIDCTDHESSVLSYLRRGEKAEDIVITVLNFTPVVRRAYRVGVPKGGLYREVFNSDSAFYQGSDLGNGGVVRADAVPMHGHAYSLELILPPLAGMVFQPEEG